MTLRGEPGGGSHGRGERGGTGRTIAGYVILIAMLPVAVLGLLAAPNEYRAMGVDAVDCDGPMSVLIFAVPALMTYGIACTIFLSRFRRSRSLVLGCICGLVCAGLAWNVARALEEHGGSRSECGAGL